MNQAGKLCRVRREDTPLRLFTSDVQLRYNYRVHPTPGQQEALVRAFGCARVGFNDGLRARQEARKAGLPYVSDGELSERQSNEPGGQPSGGVSAARWFRLRAGGDRALPPRGRPGRGYARPTGPRKGPCGVR
ncbi:helix-turn-helix domain-containing protein [Micromonospora sp. NPDC052213]|uniref:helix-turn-helix domain-containing protein n=1 Tax=Micromonospora sp. NPDC052213 TaxID=3155812 RepID=UPI0034428CBC